MIARQPRFAAVSLEVYCPKVERGSVRALRAEQSAEAPFGAFRATAPDFSIGRSRAGACRSGCARAFSWDRSTGGVSLGASAVRGRARRG
jgi:hypothetical protein